MTRLCLAAALFNAALDAAVIRGVVLDAGTGRPLARALVTLRPVEGTAGAAATVRAGRTGGFEFEQLPGGAWLLQASRYGFATFKYGQKTWKGTGSAIVLEANGSAFLDIRLKRYGAISGTVWDENEVGIPEHEVMAYRATRPPRLVTRAKTDDRGMYRLFGLEPGAYFVRTAARQFDDLGYLPTFSRETTRVEEAHSTDVELDHQAADVNVRPATGRLLTVGGRIIGYPLVAATVTLVSDTGPVRTAVDGGGNFEFRNLAPGDYELEARAAGSRYDGEQAIWQPLHLDRDRADLNVPLQRIPQVEFRFENQKGEAVDGRGLTVLTRRKDLAGESAPQSVRVSGGRVPLIPGRWDLALAPNPSFYAAGFNAPRIAATERGRPDGWNEVTVMGGVLTVTFVLSLRPGSVHGKVTGSGREPVPGAPVYLEAWDLDARRRLIDLRTTYTDLRGDYRFQGLPPGKYRILSTTEYEDPDSMVMEAAGARVVDVEEARDAAQDLDLYVRN